MAAEKAPVKAPEKAPDKAKMSCCRTEVQAHSNPQMVTTPPATDVCPLHPAQLAVDAATRTIIPFLVTSHLSEEHSPPALLTTRTTVLRI